MKLSTGFALNFIAAFWSLPGKCPVDHSTGICVVLPGACYIATTNAWKNSGNCTNAAQVDAIGSVRKVCELIYM